MHCRKFLEARIKLNLPANNHNDLTTKTLQANTALEIKNQPGFKRSWRTDDLPDLKQGLIQAVMNESDGEVVVKSNSNSSVIFTSGIIPSNKL